MLVSHNFEIQPTYCLDEVHGSANEFSNKVEVKRAAL